MKRSIARTLLIISSLTLPLVWIAGDTNLREMTLKIDAKKQAIELHLRKEPTISPRPIPDRDRSSKNPCPPLFPADFCFQDNHPALPFPSKNLE